MKKDYRDNKIVVAVIFVVFAVAFCWAFKYKNLSKAFPLFVCGLGMLFALFEFISIVRKERKQKPVTKPKRVTPETRKKIIIMFLMIVAYLLLISFIGWGVASLLFMLAVSLYMDVPGMQKWKIALIACSITVVFFVVFKVLMHLNLPKGILI